MSDDFFQLFENCLWPLSHIFNKATIQSATRALTQTATQLAENPEFVQKIQKDWVQELNQLYFEVLNQTNQQLNAMVPTQTLSKDKRFRHSAWDENPYFYFLKESYLLGSRFISQCVEQVPGQQPDNLKRASFFIRQFLDAISPSNFPGTNPTIIEEIIETGGQNLIKGMENFWDDWQKYHEKFLISMSPPHAFTLGKDLAATPGKVVFQNELFQLIQYNPMTPQVLKIPLLIVPPLINKFYIFDLRDSNSFVRWAVEQGHTVFIISWANPDDRFANKTFEDYIYQGVETAINLAQILSNEPKINLLGFCIGGNLIACTAAYLATIGKDVIASITYLATIVDFMKAGDLTVFIDDEQLQDLENKMFSKGYLPGQELLSTFSLLRANDLIWSFFINNYWLGKEPPIFDFLYWNSDCTNIPAKVHSYYLRNMFQKNLFWKSNGLKLGNILIDLTKICSPTFVLATSEDHISPWISCYPATQIYKGAMEFVLASSGHIAGIMNPPQAKKYTYLTNRKFKIFPTNPEDWLQKATIHKGSWWPYWQKWALKLSKDTVSARTPGQNPDFPILETAPGSYVKVRASH